MNPLEIAFARANAYALFETLFLRGITPSTIDTLKQVPDLADKVDFERGFEELAADHYSLFVHNMPPYASIFLEADGLPGGNATEQAASAYKECGFIRKGTSEAADHIGHMLGCLSFLCGAESDAWSDGLPEVAGQIRQLQVKVLENQFLPWAFPFLHGVQSHNNLFFSDLARLAVDTAADHYQNLETLHSPFIPPSTDMTSADDIGNNDTSIHDIVDFLLKPARSGLWLSPEMIGQLGREFELPRGFGERKTILLNMLQAAGKYDAFAKLTKKISEQYSNAQATFEKIRVDQPYLSPFLVPWGLKIEATNTMLNNLEQTWEASQ